MAEIRNTSDSIRSEIGKLQAQLNTTNAAMGSAPADRLGELSIKASGLENALGLLARRLRAAEIAELDVEIAQQEQAVKVAQREVNTTIAARETAEGTLRAAQAAASDVSRFSDEAIEAVVLATAAKIRADMRAARADYARSVASGELRDLLEARKELTTG